MQKRDHDEPHGKDWEAVLSALEGIENALIRIADGVDALVELQQQLNDAAEEAIGTDPGTAPGSGV